MTRFIFVMSLRNKFCGQQWIDVVYLLNWMIQVFVFDFGSEMYVWTGKHVPFDRRKKLLKLAIELWDAGYDYSRCDINPLCPLIRTSAYVCCL